MKIAFVTEDGRTIGAHFGRAPYYAVIAVEEGRVISRELRPKLGHAQFTAESPGLSGYTQVAEESPGSHGTRHGMDVASQGRHANMAAAIQDCQVLIARGMGYGAYEAMRSFGITPIVTDEVEIEAALQAYLNGHLADHPEYLH